MTYHYAMAMKLPRLSELRDPWPVVIAVAALCFSAFAAFAVLSLIPGRIPEVPVSPSAGDFSLTGCELLAWPVSAENLDNLISYGFRASVRNSSSKYLSLDNVYAVVVVAGAENPVGVARGFGSVPVGTSALLFDTIWYRASDNSQTFYGPLVSLGATYTLRVNLRLAPSASGAFAGLGVLLDNAEFLVTVA